MLEEIIEAAEGTPYNQINSYFECGRINDFIRLAIEEDVSSVKIVNLEQGAVSGVKEGTQSHMYVKIPKESIDYNEPIIIDGALDQFNKLNYEDGEKDTEVLIGNKADIPSLITIFPEDAEVSQNHTEFKKYYKSEQF